MNKGILLNDDNELRIEKGGLMVGNTKIQEAFLVLSMNKGELKEVPLVGVNLLPMIRGKERRERIRKAVEIGLERIGIKYDDIKGQLELIINKLSV